MIQNLCSRYPSLAPLCPCIEKAFDMLAESIQTGHKIMTCGNGGSASDAEHIVGELMKGFLLPRPLLNEQNAALAAMFPEDAQKLSAHLQQGIPALSLVSGVALPTAFANDISAEFVFAQQVLTLGQKGDVLWGISTSGNSANIIQAFKIARAFGIKTLGLTGRDGGKLAKLCDVEIRIPATSTPEIQELHLPVYHAICATLEKKIFGNITQQG